MTNPFSQAEVATENSFSQFNAFESAAPSALKEFPMIAPETRPTTSEALTQYDSTQNQPFEITDGDQVVASSCSTGGCSCSEYVARGWNRNASARNSYSSYSSSDSGSCDSNDSDNSSGDCGPGDGGGCSSGGGPMRGMLGRFGRGGLLGRLFGGGGLGLLRAFRR